MSFFSKEVRSLRVLKVLAVVLSLMIGGGYLYSWAAAAPWTKLRPGLTVAQTIEIVGPPTDEVTPKDPRRVELWYSSGDRPFKLIFKDGRLANMKFNGKGKSDPLRQYK